MSALYIITVPISILLSAIVYLKILCEFCTPLILHLNDIELSVS